MDTYNPQVHLNNGVDSIIQVGCANEDYFRMT